MNDYEISIQLRVKNKLLNDAIKRKYGTVINFSKELSKLWGKTECSVRCRLAEISGMRKRASEEEMEDIESLLCEKVFTNRIKQLAKGLEGRKRSLDVTEEYVKLGHNESIKMLGSIEDESSHEEIVMFDNKEASEKILEKMNKFFEGLNNKKSRLYKMWQVVKWTRGICGEAKLSYQEIADRLGYSKETIENMNSEALGVLAEMTIRSPMLRNLDVMLKDIFGSVDIEQALLVHNRDIIVNGMSAFAEEIEAQVSSIGE